MGYQSPKDLFVDIFKVPCLAGQGNILGTEKFSDEY
jgi:hypothetical protein